MTLVVADTGPISYLTLIDAVHLLPRLFEKVILPDSVYRELLDPDAPLTVLNFARALPPWIEVRQAQQVELQDLLDPGEAEAIALAAELDALVLLDDRDGRREALRLGLRVAGTIGILEKAAQQDLINLTEAFEKLRFTNFRIDPEYLRQALARDAARRYPPLNP